MPRSAQQCPACATKKDAGKFICALCGGSGFLPPTDDETASPPSQAATGNYSGHWICGGTIVGLLISLLVAARLLYFGIDLSYSEMDATGPQTIGVVVGIIAVITMPMVGAYIGWKLGKAGTR